MLWISWDNNQIFKAKNMLKLFSLIKRFFRVGPEERPGKVRGGGQNFFLERLRAQNYKAPP